MNQEEVVETGCEEKDEEWGFTPSKSSKSGVTSQESKDRHEIKFLK